MAGSDAGRQERHLRLWQWLLLIVLGILIILTIQIVYAYWVLNFAKFGDTDMTPRGQFGDIFGGVNAFFTGAAFAGLIITILLQRSELELQRKQLEDSTKAQEGSQEALRDQVRVLEESARVSVMSALVDAYTNRIGTMEQGKFRGDLWAANVEIGDKIKHWVEVEFGEPPGVKESMRAEIRKSVGSYIRKYPDSPKSEWFSNSQNRRAFEAWVYVRRRRNHFLAILEDEFESSVSGQRVMREYKRPSPPDT